MGDVLKVVPRNREEFYAKILELYKGRDHVKSIQVDEVSSCISIHLDGTAHTFGHQDMMIPIKRSDVAHALEIVTHINQAVTQRVPPSRSDSDQLFGLLDLGP